MQAERYVKRSRHWRCGGIVLAIVVAVLSSPRPVIAVDPTRVALEAPPVATPTAFLERLERVERELNRLGQPSALPMPRPAVLPLIDDARLQFSNVYDVSGTRFLFLRLSLYNQSDKPLALDTTRISLLVDGQAQNFKGIPEGFRGHVIETGWRPLMVAEAIPPASVNLPAGEVAPLTLVFAPIATRAAAPSLILRYESEGKAVDLDLNRFQRGLLELDSIRIGPGGCCLLATIGGTLDTINSADLADRLQAAVTQGVHRAVVVWKAGTPTPAPDLIGWLGSASNNENPLYAQFAALPTDLQEFHLATVPAGAAVERLEDTRTSSHPDVESAVSAALASVYPRQSRETILGDLKSEHSAVRAAALRFGAGALTSADLAAVMKAMADPSPAVERSACAALAEFDDARSRDALLKIVTESKPPLSTAAFEALAASRFAANVAAAGEVCDSVSTIPDVELLRILIRYPQVKFQKRILKEAASGSPEARTIALAALVAIRTPKAEKVFSESLQSPEEPIRNAAFSAIVARLGDGDPKMRSLAVEEAIQRLSKNPSDPLARSVSEQTRDARILTVLLPRVSDGSRDRIELIDLIGRIGGDTVTSTLVENYPQFKPAERAAALRHLWFQQSSAAVDFAVEDILSTDVALVERSLEVLKNEASDRSVRAIAAALAGRQNNDGYSLAEALATIGSPAAYDELLKLRESPKSVVRGFALWAFEQIWMRSPGHDVSETAARMLDQQLILAQPAQQIDSAIEMFNAAVELDRLLPDAYKGRGNARLRKSDWDGAIPDFEAALELNPYDHIALTGLTIAWVMTGREVEAVQWIDESAPLLETNATFHYNAACVFGRMAEKTLLEPQTPERDARVSASRDRAFAFLENAFLHSFRQADLMQADPDLAALRDDPRFARLKTRMALEE